MCRYVGWTAPQFSSWLLSKHQKDFSRMVTTSGITVFIFRCPNCTRLFFDTHEEMRTYPLKHAILAPQHCPLVQYPVQISISYPCNDCRPSGPLTNEHPA